MLEQATQILQIVAYLVIAVALVYAALQINGIRRTIRETNSWNRRKAAQDMIFQIDKNASVCTDLNRHFGIFKKREPIPLAKIQKAFSENSELEFRLVELLNAYSALARGVLEGVYDEQIVYDASSARLVKIHNSFQMYIEFRHQEQGPHLYTALETLACEWRARLSPADRRDLTGGV